MLTGRWPVRIYLMDGVLLSLLTFLSSKSGYFVSVVFVNLCLSEGDKDAAPADSSEEGLGGSSQLHLWTEGRLHPLVQGSEGRHVSAPTHQ